MANSVFIKIHGGVFCESRQDESVLSALVRAGIPVSAPCGGRGICGKCRLTLLEGSVRLTDGAEVKAGSSFCACRAAALCDITVLLPEGESIDAPLAVMQGGKIGRAGIGIDIGTTTVQAQLVDLDTGEVLQTFSALNNQRSFGADVMSRIDAARKGKLEELSEVIKNQIEETLRLCIDKWNLPEIEQCTVSGNTTMLHLFCGADPSAMGEAPYTPVFLEERNFEGRELSLSAKNVTLLPGISAFVGADIVSGLAFLDIMKKNENAFFIDIGTNGEIAVWKESGKKLLCSSTAAGPCFEGAEISCGMGAESGAINRISLKEEKIIPLPTPPSLFHFGQLYYTTLGNAKARGICGAGLIDAVAVIKKSGAMDETGALADEFTQTGFPIAEGIVITQRDVRQFQLAKSAIYSGIKVLCKKAGLRFENVDTAYIAGGLGFFINLENAADIGLIPASLIKKTAVCGNTSLSGAVKSLTDTAFLPRCREIASCAVVEDLALSGDFTEEFADNMFF
jgi:uncharacterized 2Fe-2S/4Fe-4S cluster protein (DUF4445 family)